eukprot:NODE_125_length_2437_cov_53.880235_g108_i0.p1 GENE.NODE_125_length_2437_cov_53.880235_g108_i0~~NODE_125_length_2437_cov_53.880235_g108_i0.p1  ORF type:complete len:232 (-),score=38.42 NODE_125_length_2437_cov_53.880235_g108_i0:954-1649(-)
MCKCKRQSNALLSSPDKFGQCLVCKAPTHGGLPVCGGCQNVGHVVFASLDQTHPKYEGIVQQFMKKWDSGVSGQVKLVAIFGVYNANSYAKYQAYCSKLSASGFLNERRLFHGCGARCHLWATRRLCGSPSCVRCSICESGFRHQPSKFNKLQFGKGHYFAFDSSKSDCYSLDSDIGGYRTMLLCKVAMGRSEILKQDRPELTQPPNGMNSVLAEIGPMSKLWQGRPEVVV